MKEKPKFDITDHFAMVTGLELTEEELFGEKVEWEDHSATNDLGINPYIIRCPFDPAFDVKEKNERE